VVSTIERPIDGCAKNICPKNCITQLVFDHAAIDPQLIWTEYRLSHGFLQIFGLDKTRLQTGGLQFLDLPGVRVRPNKMRRRALVIPVKALPGPGKKRPAPG